MNGNARVDIVVTERCNDDATGTTRWLLGRLHLQVGSEPRGALPEAGMLG
ncbi:hypothetical protein [Sorangium sp. So ce1153]